MQKRRKVNCPSNSSFTRKVLPTRCLPIIFSNALKLALSMLKIPLRATLLPIRLALSGIFCIFAAKISYWFNLFII